MPKTRNRDAADSIARVLAHPVRVDILTILHEGDSVSQKDLARQLREPLKNIGRHINKLNAAGAIEVAFTKKVGNVDQHYWRAIKTSALYPEDLAELTHEERQSFSQIIVQSIMAETLASLRAGLLAGDPYVAVCWDRIWLDEQGYKDLSHFTGVFLDRMYECARESVDRIAESGEIPKLYIGAVMAFERSRREPNTRVTVGDLGQEPSSGREPSFDVAHSASNSADAADSIARVLAHPVRVDILTILHEGDVASPKDLARQLREPLSNITHHINMLNAAGAIEVAFTKKVGSGDQRYWRALKMSALYPDDLAELTREEHQSFSQIIVQSIMAETLASLRAGRLAGDPCVALCWDRIWLDEQGYKDLSHFTGAFLDRMYETVRESVDRIAESGEIPKLYIGAVMAFERSRREPNTSVTVGDLGQEPSSGREPSIEK